MRAHGGRRHGAVTIVLGLVVAAAAVLVATPEADAASRVSIYVTPTGFLSGNHVTARGRSSTKQRRAVQLQVLTPTGWQVAASGRTKARGKYALTDPVSRTGQFRVVLPRARVNRRTLPGLTSPVRTVGMASELLSGQTLAAGQYLTSADGAYLLTMQPDGNLTLTTSADPTTIIWSTATSGHPGARLVMQFQGNLVLVDPTGLLLWSTNTSASGASLGVGTDGNVYVHQGATMLWDRTQGLYVPAPPVGASQAALRGNSWVDARVAYSQSKYFTNQYGRYRTDCSGYVSMMWGLTSSYTTRTIPSISTVITKDQLASGDVLNSAGNHVVLFDAWADAAHTQYWGYEETPSSGAAHHVIPYPYWPGHRTGTFIPRRKS